MNIPKNVDYFVMFTAMDVVIDAGLPQGKIKSNAHLKIQLDEFEVQCYTETND